MQGTEVSWYTKVSAFDPYKVLACDMIWDPAIIAHPQKNSISFNLAFIDGHVTTVHDQFLFNSTANDIPWPGGTGNHGIATLDDDIDILEAEADGRNPEVSGGSPNEQFYIYNASGGPGSTSYYPWIYRLQHSNSSSPYSSGNTGTDHPAVPWS
jgi:prepilin-type processing-associated H-X9-DG protein